MNWDSLKGQWNQIKGTAKQRWGKFTDDELTEIAGQRDKLVGKLQEKYGMMKEDAEREADQFAEAGR